MRPLLVSINYNYRSKMKKLKPIILSKILKKHDLCHNSIISKAARLLELNKSLQSFLPNPLGENCGISNLNGGNITLYARTPAWCYKLRLHASEIRNFLIRKGVSIQNVSIVVIPSSPEVSTKILPRAKISQHSQESIRKTAEAMEDSELKVALMHFLKSIDADNSH